MVDAIPALVTDKSIQMFERFHVFNAAELHSRAEIKYESYNKAVNIEALTMIDMTVKQILPAVIEYTGTLSDIIQSLKAIDVGSDRSVRTAQRYYVPAQRSQCRCPGTPQSDR